MPEKILEETVRCPRTSGATDKGIFYRGAILCAYYHPVAKEDLSCKDFFQDRTCTITLPPRKCIWKDLSY